LTFSIKGDSVNIGWQVRLLCPWARHWTGLPSYVWVVRLVITGGSLIEDRKGHFAIFWPKQLGK